MSHNRSRVKHSNRVNHGNFPKPQRAGDVVNYHVLKCRPVINSTSPQVSNQHLQVLLQIESGQRYWVTINIREQSDKVYFYLDENYTHPVTQKILDAALPEGFTKLQSQPGGIALDYIREQLFDFGQLQLLGPDGTSDLQTSLTTQITNAYRFNDARIFVFGSRFTDGVPFSSYALPEGIHDIHMNQGSKPPHDGSNGIYQDGALLIHYPTENRWSAVFLKFESQTTETDDHGNNI